MNKNYFVGKTAIVTGGAMGIGKQIATQLLKLGVKVFIADISPKAADVAEELAKLGEIYAISCDISSYDDCQRVVDACIAKTQSIDFIVNNAAIQDELPFEKVTSAQFKRVLDVNILGIFNMINAAKPHLKKGSRIVNMSTVHAVLTRLNKYSYDASKAAVEMMTREFALAFANEGINVNLVRLGACLTEMNADFITDPTKMQASISRIPFGRLVEKEEVANMVIFLLSEEAKFMTGSSLTIDGGRSLK